MPPPLDSAGAAFCLRVLPLTALAQVSAQAEPATRAPQALCWLEKGPQPCWGERERDEFISLVLRIQKFTLMRKGPLVFDPGTCGPAPELRTLLSFRMRSK